jgi:hypothetical protein
MWLGDRQVARLKGVSGVEDRRKLRAERRRAAAPTDRLLQEGRRARQY